MNWKKRFMAVFCAAAMMLTLSPPPAQASSDMIFIALNDQLVPKLTTNTMPIWYSNTYYVPYTVFDKAYISANFGMSVDLVDLDVNVAATNNTVLLYNRRRQLTYDLDAGTCVGKDGVSYKRAVVLGGIIYLPIYAVRDYFAEDGLTFQKLNTPYGALLRLSTPSATLPDDMFADAAALSMPAMIREYNQSLSPSPSPSPSLSPSPSPPPSPSPSPSPGQVPDKRGVKVYFAFQVTGGGDLKDLLDRLGLLNIPALFFFAPQDLATNEALVRRIIGSGHAVGLTVPGGPAEDAKALLEEGNRLLSLIAHTNTRTVTIENGDSAATIALDAAGWSVWRDNVPVSPDGLSAGALSDAVMGIVDAKKAVARIQLDDSLRTVATLDYLIAALREEKYDIRLAVGGVFT